MRGTPEIAVLDSPDALAHEAARRFEAEATASISARDRFAVSLSGGTTPKRMLNLLASAPFSRRLDWSRTHFFWGDERCVRPDDARSNYGMVRRALLDQIDVPAANVHRMRGELDPQEGAREYCDQLRAFFGGDQTPFDLLLLGVGPDGHVASLFPGTPALTVTDRACVANDVGENLIARWRLTLTYPAINAARKISFLVSGPEKADVLAQIINGPHDPNRMPAQGVDPREGSTTWLIDRAAAAKL